MKRIKAYIALALRATWGVLVARWPERVAVPTVRILFVLCGIVVLLGASAIGNRPTLESEAELRSTTAIIPIGEDGVVRVLSVDTKLSSHYMSYIYKLTKKHSADYNLDPLLVMSIMSTESTFRVSATSEKECAGLMQINWASWGTKLQRLGIARDAADIYNPDVNIEAGCYVYSTLLEENHGSHDAALNRYLGTSNETYRRNVYAIYGRLKLVASQRGD